nr:hypothetical protein Iba_chr03cCG13350 [Ipomoea batatas]
MAESALQIRKDRVKENGKQNDKRSAATEFSLFLFRPFNEARNRSQRLHLELQCQYVTGRLFKQLVHSQRLPAGDYPLEGQDLLLHLRFLICLFPFAPLHPIRCLLRLVHLRPPCAAATGQRLLERIANPGKLVGGAGELVLCGECGGEEEIRMVIEGERERGVVVRY